MQISDLLAVSYRSKSPKWEHSPISNPVKNTDSDEQGKSWGGVDFCSFESSMR